MNTSKSKIPGIVIKLTAAALILLLLWQCVGFRCQWFEAGGCTSITFDKWAVKGADRVVVYKDDKTFTITDKAAVKQIAGYFTVANRTDLCDDEFGIRLEIYRGDRLVRSVQEVCAGYHIYDAGLAHWIFPSDGKLGLVELTYKQREALTALLEQYK